MQAGGVKDKIAQQKSRLFTSHNHNIIQNNKQNRNYRV